MASIKRLLPTVPNSDNLRKQAKARLAEMRLRTPAVRLAEAQLLLAQEYGFASWTALQAEVARRSESPQGQWRRVQRVHLAAFRPGWWPEDRSHEEDEETLGGFWRAAGIVPTGFLIVVMVGLALIAWEMHQRGLLPALPK